MLSVMEINTAGNGVRGRPEALSKRGRVFQGRDLDLGFVKLSSLFVVILIYKRMRLIQQNTLGSERIIIAGNIHFTELSQQANKVHVLYPFYRARRCEMRGPTMGCVGETDRPPLTKPRVGRHAAPGLIQRCVRLGLGRQKTLKADGEDRDVPL